MSKRPDVRDLVRKEITINRFTTDGVFNAVERFLVCRRGVFSHLKSTRIDLTQHEKHSASNDLSTSSDICSAVMFTFTHSRWREERINIVSLKIDRGTGTLSREIRQLLGNQNGIGVTDLGRPFSSSSEGCRVGIVVRHPSANQP